MQSKVDLNVWGINATKAAFNVILRQWVHEWQILIALSGNM
jgi:hypothetical protein